MTEEFSITRCITIGRYMGYTEKDVWRMTVRKLMVLYKDYQRFNGDYKEPETIDDVIPI